MIKIENLGLKDFFTIIRRRIWYLIVTAVLVSAAAVTYVWWLPSTYKSETTIVLAGRLLPEDYIRSIDRGTANERIDFVRQQIQSRTFLGKIVQEFQLAPPDATNTEVVMNSLRKRIEILMLSPNSFKLSVTTTDAVLAQSLTRRLAEGVIQLNDSFRKEKAQVADQYLEEQARQAADQLSQAEEKLWQFRNQNFAGNSQGSANPEELRSLRVELNTLDGRLQSIVNQKKALERRLEERQQLKAVVSSAVPRPSVALPTSSGPVSTTARSPLEERLSKARADLQAASLRYTPLHPEVTRLAQEVEELESLIQHSSVAGKSDAAPRRDDTTERGAAAVIPEIGSSVEVLESEIRGEIDQLSGEGTKLEQSRKTLLSRISVAESQLNPSTALAQQLALLTREYDSAKQRYSYLSDKKMTSEMAARLDTSADNEVFRIIDEAYLPMFPISPNRRLLAAAACLAGLLAGLGAAFGREYLDSTLHTEADALAELKLPVLGGIPNIQANLPQGKKKTLWLPAPKPIPEQVGEKKKFYLDRAEDKVRDIIMDPFAPAGEPYRLMHAKLLALQKERRIKTILITSAMPDEGKTFASACLAGVLARESGKKVLLIDADLRTGSASRVLGISEGGVGLVELLDDARESAGLSQAFPAAYGDCDVQPTSGNVERTIIECAEVNMHLLPSGITREKPSHLLNTPILEALLREAERLYDWVIIDSPPVLALADANILAPLCDGTVMVVRTGKTPSALVKQAIQRIGTERICGLLMNRVRGERAAYYYGSYYRRPVQAGKG